MQFKITDAAFEGVRLIRREPRTIAIWAVFSLVAGLAMTAAMIGVGFGRFTNGATPTPEMMDGLFLGQGVAMGGAVLVAAIMGAAVYRAILRPDEAPVTRLRFGADELRLVLLSVIVGILFTVLLFALSIPVVIVGAALAVGMGIGRDGAAAGGGAMAGLILSMAVGYLLIIAGFIYFAVRLSLAGVMTFAERRLRVFESWRLTKGRFWRLLGAYGLAIVLMLPIYAVVTALYFGVGLAFSGGDFGRAVGEITRPDMTSIAAYLSPARIAYLLLSGVAGGVLNALMYAPAAAVYRAIADTRPESQAEVFS